ncbi:MAG: response regulator [Bacteroidetes bacterium]|nr:response regulator [Bacteroidota bacterium]
MKKIVLIEDDVTLSQNLIEILQDEFDIDHASNGQQGVELVKAQLPDLVISDILMPEFTGHDIKRIFNADPLLSTIPFIFLTAKADKKDIRKGMDLGADDYLTKPFTREELLNSIHSRIKKSEIFKKHNSELTKSIAMALPHELNNPLISIIGYSEIILEQVNRCKFNECSDIVTSTQIINSAGRELSEILKRYLLVVKLQMIYSDVNEKKKYSERIKEPTDLKIIYELIDAANRKHSTNRIVLEHNAKNIQLAISEEDLTIIINELLDNSLKFSDNESKIIVYVNSENKNCEVEFKNFGRGMTEEQISNIGFFQQFEREKFEQKGSGVGLAIVQKLIELNEGCFDIKSEPGFETVVTVSIPIKNY